MTGKSNPSADAQLEISQRPSEIARASVENQAGGSRAGEPNISTSDVTFPEPVLEAVALALDDALGFWVEERWARMCFLSITQEDLLKLAGIVLNAALRAQAIIAP